MRLSSLSFTLVLVGACGGNADLGNEPSDSGARTTSSRGSSTTSTSSGLGGSRTATTSVACCNGVTPLLAQVTVESATTGAIITDATLTIGSATVDASQGGADGGLNGIYAFETAGVVTLTVSAPGYATQALTDVTSGYQGLCDDVCGYSVSHVAPSVLTVKLVPLGGSDAGTDACSAPTIGAPVTLWTGAVNPIDQTFAMAVNATDLYWVSESETNKDSTTVGSVMTVPIAGGAATTIFTDMVDDLPQQLALDSASVYWSDDGWNINKAPLGGGPATTLVKGTNLGNNIGGGIGGFAVDSGEIYFTTGDHDTGDVLLETVASTGGAISMYWPGSPAGMRNPVGGGVAFDAVNVYWENTTTGSGILSCGGECVIPNYQTSILALPFGGGIGDRQAITLATTPFSESQATTNTVIVDDGVVYFTSDGAMVSVPTSGGGTVTTLAASPPVIGNFAYDGESLYWASYSDCRGLVAKVAKSGGAVTTVFSQDGAAVLGTAVDANNLYVFYAIDFTAQLGPTGVVAKMPK
jgi:hypothetical protein